MGNNDQLTIIGVFIALHTVLIGLVRPLTLSQSMNIMTQMSNTIKELKSKISYDENASKNIIAFQRWQNTIMFFSCLFWIYAIANGILVGTTYFFPEFPLLDFLYFISISYFVFVIIAICKEYRYICESRCLFAIVVTLFFVAPSSLYCIHKYLSEIALILTISCLSVLDLLIWHMLWIFFSPLLSLKKLIAAQQGIDTDEF